MSWTTLHGFEPDGDLVDVREFHNAWGGAMYIWTQLAREYLDSDAMRFLFREEEARRLWSLWRRSDLPDHHAATLLSTLDKLVLEPDRFAALADAFDRFVADFPTSGVCSLPQQAETLRAMAGDDRGWRGVAWTQTSVAPDVWTVWDEGQDDGRPYNLDRDRGHHFIYEELGSR